MDYPAHASTAQRFASRAWHCRLCKQVADPQRRALRPVTTLPSEGSDRDGAVEVRGSSCPTAARFLADVVITRPASRRGSVCLVSAASVAARPDTEGGEVDSLDGLVDLAADAGGEEVLFE